MNAAVTAHGLTVGNGQTQLFAGLDLSAHDREVVGVIGPNGAGKSTLLRVLAGEVPPSSGSISYSRRNARIGYFAQSADWSADESIEDYLARRTGVDVARHDLETAAAALGTDVIGAADRYEDALDRFLASGASDFESRIGPALSAVRMEGRHAEHMSELSGGEGSRIRLASLMLSRFDLFLLDEPTNDLDLAGLTLLEAFIAGSTSAIVLVSHDRELLSRVVDRVVEIDSGQDEVNVYGGGYDAFLHERGHRRAQRREAFESYTRTKDDLLARARTQRDWVNQGLRRQRTSSQSTDKMARRAAVEGTEKQAHKARIAEQKVERLEVVEEPRKEWSLQFSIAAGLRPPTVLATLDDVVVTRELGFTLGPIRAEIRRGDRIAVVGENGSGKSTLFDALRGSVVPTSGRVSFGTGLSVGVIDQRRQTLPEELDLVSAVSQTLPGLEAREVRTLLAKFQLGPEDIRRRTGELSLGERTRAAMAVLQAMGVNLLLLDEPTNHLDLEAIEQLEAALDAYDGTMLVVTHDRRMLEAVSFTRRWVLDGGLLMESAL
ncbi:MULTISPECIES: ABC-F family ATP-binding cassette domain-containing protein [unclassified Microbacterium]|uniref:ABC-F family ATP-binding cassette domain-containing protein n=1 Tax=unclassified Microbacterium TaxID=2609290 RepID=UPI000CFDEBD5|nr:MULTISPECIES: ABC-F family ATP-binding cassette domain-containing protein [unclassified Microbacterium]PQZ53511.1 heme ABC transporter ATP-binding protein [Microbacterium sp. MYb43]PQZ75113.1 heme ABC transporter ATP-binding protein [Microbacterium sp. MYb40]PRB19408.1 heme ABC transporter ATP-binding protein [Microbacterium sp. MYb54]PRB24609.1 heme ABC transporter ATP-binding protein [Microbacterium sp. MYb50]PRB63720.1 heme ABC transporter ATP-binding protein [Microbacterium sp. MYb24]